MDVLKSRSFLIIVGLPASGKTYLARKLAHQNKCSVLDDPRTLKQVIKFMKNHDRGIITHPNFCIPEFRNNLKSWIKSENIKVSLKWLFFENDLIQCLRNDQNRDQRAETDIYYFSSIYKIPSQSQIIKVYSKKSKKKT